jgi:predicted metal-dependent phosphoesterase TrpH
VGIDLHIHSSASDGSLSPAEILTGAEKLGLEAISITDHDTLAGSASVFNSSQQSAVNLLTGVEISTAPPPPAPISGSLHILGYGFQIDDTKLGEMLLVLQQARKNRNPAILKRLQHLGIEISFEEVVQTVGPGQIGRPHIARVLMEKGLVASIDEAFDQYLGQGKPAYIDKYRIPCSEAIETILAAGGIPVLAHPYLLNIERDSDLEQFVISLMDMGLKGLEVYYPEHPPDKIRLYERIATKYGLLMTGGTDFHGSIKPEVQMGIGNGHFYVPYRLYEELVAKLT